MKTAGNQRRPAHAIQPPPVPAKETVRGGRASSRSRDIREDHGTRKIKTASNPRTLPHRP
jgi:hypothetical protein